MSKLSPISCLLLPLLLGTGCWASIAAAQVTPQILILSSGDSMLPASRILSDELNEGLKSGLGQDVDIFVEFLDAIRYPDPEYSTMLDELMERKHGGKQFDLVFALGPPAYQFVAQRRTKSYLRAPAVYLAMRESTIAKLPPLANATGVVSRYDLVETVRLSKLLQPSLQNLYVVTGAGDFDRDWEDAARRELAAYSEELNVSFLAALPLAELRSRLGALPSGSALLYLTMLEDGHGAVYLAPEVAEMLAQAAPVYSVYSTYLDRGIVGGYMDTFEAVGRAGAALGVRILQGEAASSIAPPPLSPQSYVVNWPAIEKWNLDVAALPKNTVIRNRETTVWKEYQEQILIFVTLLALQTLLIIALLTQGRRKRLAEARLEESEDRIRLAASSANLGLWRWDSDSNKVWMTDHCRRILGLPGDAEVTIGSLLTTIHAEDRFPLQRQIEQSARWEKPFDAESRIVLPDGTTRWLSVKGQSARNSASPADQVTGVVIDVSERKAAQIEAEQQRSQLTHLTRVAILGELSGAMAHELNQPLAAILSNAQAAQRLLDRDPPDLDESRAILSDIVADDLRASEVIRRLRSLLKRDEGRQEPIDLSRLAEDVLHLARSELVTHQVGLQAELDPELSAVMGDRVQLQQVFLNLIMNACEAMRDTPPQSRLLTITSREGKGRDIEIVFADSGPGIAAEMLEQLFEPFASTKPQGLGLGLSISRAIVAAHNGHLHARNGEHGGATFIVRLPSEG